MIRAALWAIAIGILFGTVISERVRGHRMNDLDIFITASERIAQGQSPYQLRTDLDEHTKPPLFNLLILPFHSIPKPLLHALWSALMLFALWACLKQVGAPPWTLDGALIVLALHQYLVPELKLGQTNLIILSLLLFAFRRTHWIAGAALFLSLLIKPNLFAFLGFFLIQRNWRSNRVFYAGVIGAFLALSIAYCASFSLTAYVDDTFEWLQMLPASSAKHLFQTANYSLASGLATLWPSLIDTAWIAPGVNIAIAVAFGFYSRGSQARAELGFGLLAWLSIIFSPMAWTQNFVFLLPLIALWMRQTRVTADLLGFALFLIFAITTQVFQFEVVGRAGHDALVSFKHHLWASFFLALAAWRGLAKKRLAD